MTTRRAPAHHGPLSGTRVVELAGIGPAPFAAMVLADLGADVVRVDRTAGAPAPLPGGTQGRGHDVLARSRRCLAVDLKSPDGVAVVLDLVAGADVLVEGFRPGVAERLGVGPQACLQRNPRLVYGRMTGWGQTGPWAQMAGHDLDYIALAGALEPIGSPGAPPPVPLNLVGDFGGGGMLLVAGVLAALVERASSGQGQVVDAAMVDGAALLTSMFHGLTAMGVWSAERGTNVLDGSAPFYSTYVCSDGGFVAVGALEPQFYAALLAGLGLDPRQWPQYDRSCWPRLRQRIAAAFASRPRDDWAAHFAGTDACVAPALRLDEAPEHEHLRARGTFVTVDGVVQPAPAPRFSRTPAGTPRAPRPPGSDTAAVLREAGLGDAAITRLRDLGVVG